MFQHLFLHYTAFPASFPNRMQHVMLAIACYIITVSRLECIPESLGNSLMLVKFSGTLPLKKAKGSHS